MNKKLEKFTEQELEKELADRRDDFLKQRAENERNERVRVAKHFILSQGNLTESDLARCNDNTILYLESKIKQCNSLNEQILKTCKDLADYYNKVELLPKRYQKLFD